LHQIVQLARKENMKKLSIRHTKKLILDLLLDGSMSIGEIADKVQLLRNAVRSHLEALESEGFVKSFFRIERLGRAKKSTK
jgi:predicted ArsR family transcriptional regulator